MASASVNFKIGRDNSTSYFSSKIDDVRVCNRALSAGDIQAIYQAAP